MKIGIVFPGQGSQRIGMGKDFYEEYETTRNTFDQASQSIQVDLAALCFEENEDINLTENTQPALLTLEIGIYSVLKEKFNIEGSYFAGHSLGEYAALVAANAIGFQDAVKIVRKRGSLMQHATVKEASGMAALLHEDIEKTRFRDILKQEQVEIANLNSKDQVVISGVTSAIQAASGVLKNEMPNMQVIELNVKTPFHSSFMRSVEAEFRNYLTDFSDKFNPKNSEKVLSNFTGTFYDPQDLIENLVKQLSGSVKWIANMNEMLGSCETIYEVGANRVLGKFFATLGAEVKSIINLRSLKKIFEQEK